MTHTALLWQCARMSGMLVWELYKRFRSTGVDASRSRELVKILIEEQGRMDFPTKVMTTQDQVFIIRTRVALDV